MNDRIPTNAKWRAARSTDGAEGERLERHKFTMGTKLPAGWSSVYPDGAKLAGELAEEFINRAAMWAQLFPKLEGEPPPTRGTLLIRILSPIPLAGTYQVVLEHLARAIETTRLP